MQMKAMPRKAVNWYVMAGNHSGYRYSLPKKYGGLPIDRCYARFNGTLNQARACCKKLIEDAHESYHKNYDAYSDATFYDPLDGCYIVKGMVVSKDDAKALDGCGRTVTYALDSITEGGWVHTRGYSGPSYNPDYDYVLLDDNAGGRVWLRTWEGRRYEVRWVPNRPGDKESYRIASNGGIIR